jgi:hypothetical protein
MRKYNSAKKMFFLYPATLLVPPKDGRRRNDKIVTQNLAVLMKIGKKRFKKCFYQSDMDMIK